MAMRLAVLHLSDLHVRGADDRVLQRGPAIAATMNGHGEQIHLCLVILSGDVAFGGSSTEYSRAREFLATLVTALETNELIGKVKVVAVPGNHDCDFSKENEPRDLILEQIRSDPNRTFASTTIAQCTSVQENFFEFLASLDSDLHIPAGGSRLLYTRQFDVGDARIRIDCYNTAWMSAREEQQGALAFPALSADDAAIADLVIAVFHHPYGWLAADNSRIFRKHIDARSDLVLTGHEHESGSYQKRELTSAVVSEYLEGGALQPHGNSTESEFNVVVVDFERRKKQVAHYAWSKDLYKCRATSAWLDMTKGGTAFKSPIAPLQGFEIFLDDCDAPFTHPSRGSVRLSDLFVYPEFREVDPDISEEPGPAAIVPGAHVLRTIFEHKRVLVHAAEGSGKTALAKNICLESLRRGLVTIYVNGADFGGKDGSTESVLSRRFTTQYPEEAHTRFQQLNVKQRAVVIDDLHRAPLNASEKSQLLQELNRRFGVIVLLGDEILRVEEITGSRVEENPILAYRHFSLLELGFELRERLIEKWRQLGREQDEFGSAVRHVANTRREVDAILGKTLVPSYPIFVLIILQQIEANTQLSTVSGSYGYLYEVLITQALARVGGEDLDTRYNYLAELAWHLFDRGTRRLSQAEFEECHLAYVKKYAVRLSFHNVRGELLKSGLIYEANGSYGFKYHYIFFYFVARFLRDDEDLRRATVDRISSELHREDYANVVIFLCYLSKDPVVIRRLLDGARALFGDVEPTDFEKAIPVWRELQSAKVALELPVTSPKDSRSKVLAEVDSVRPLARDPEDGQAISDFEDVMKINTAMKTLQILGQVLRNFPGSLKAELKYEIAKECYMLGLRALGRLFKLMESNMEPLLEEVVRVLRDRHFNDVELLSRAKKMVFALGELLALVFVKKIANSVGLERLGQTYDRVLTENDTVAVALVDVAIRLEHFTQFPETAVRDLVKRTQKLQFPYGLLRVLVFENFVLYPSDYQLRQRVCAMLNISVNKARGPGQLKG
jgi:predicted MPP superfamily phosphohydrolase